MKTLKKIAGMLCVALIALNTFAQSKESTVESEYLSSVEDVVIT